MNTTEIALAASPAAVLAATVAGYAAARLRRAAPSGQHPRFVGRPPGPPAAPAVPWQEVPRQPIRVRRARYGWRAVVTLLAAAAMYAALTVYAHATGPAPLAAAVLAAAVAWSRVRPPKTRRRRAARW